MSRVGTEEGVEVESFPRVSGDEPGVINGALNIVKFSPRERG